MPDFTTYSDEGLKDFIERKKRFAAKLEEELDEVKSDIFNAGSTLYERYADEAWEINLDA